MATDYAKELAKIKDAWGITGDDLDAKLEELLALTKGNPMVEQIRQALKDALGPAGIDLMLLGVAKEIKDLIKTGKSVPKKNRSALA